MQLKYLIPQQVRVSGKEFRPEVDPSAAVTLGSDCDAFKRNLASTDPESKVTKRSRPGLKNFTAWLRTGTTVATEFLPTTPHDEVDVAENSQ